MSYLSLPSLNLADVQKGTISLWFRFSQDAVDKAKSYRSEKEQPDGPGILDSTIPLVTFGREVMAKLYDTKFKKFTFTVPAPGAGTLTEVVSQVDDKGREAPCAPSHIGILCTSPPGSDEKTAPTPKLVMKFQTETRALVQGLHAQIKTVEWKLDPAGGDYNMHRTFEDVSYISVGEPESFLIVPTFNIEVDKWHHLLVSFDFSAGVDVVAIETKISDPPLNQDEVRDKTIKNFCKLWFAFDDENKIGKDNVGDNSVPDSPTGWVPADSNGIITQNAEAATFSYTKTPPVTDSAGKPLDVNPVKDPEFHWAASPIATESGPMGFPASEGFVEAISHCEMADFQFFSGVTIDTDNEENRRAFVDADGKPVPPSKSGDEGSPPGSIELLSQRPDVLLRQSSNWKKGKNTGATGTNDEGSEIPEGQFEPTARIASYKPDPILGG